MKTHFVYRWDHEDGFYYVGKHSGTEEDGYKGSGILFKLFYNENPNKWTRTILTEHSTSDLALSAEKRTVGDKWKTDPMCLNVCPGGKVHNRAMVGYYKAKMIYIYLHLMKNEKHK